MEIYFDDTSLSETIQVLRKRCDAERSKCKDLIIFFTKNKPNFKPLVIAQGCIRQVSSAKILGLNFSSDLSCCILRDFLDCKSSYLWNVRTKLDNKQPRTQALSSGKERPWSELVTWRLQNWLPKGVWAKCQITYATTSGFYTSIARISHYFSIMIIC